MTRINQSPRRSAVGEVGSNPGCTECVALFRPYAWRYCCIFRAVASARSLSASASPLQQPERPMRVLRPHLVDLVIGIAALPKCCFLLSRDHERYACLRRLFPGRRVVLLIELRSWRWTLHSVRSHHEQFKRFDCPNEFICSLRAGEFARYPDLSSRSVENLEWHARRRRERRLVGFALPRDTLAMLRGGHIVMLPRLFTRRIMRAPLPLYHFRCFAIGRNN